MENSLAIMKPELISEWSEKNTLAPEQVPFGSNKIYWWRGKCGHEWQTSAKARSHGEGCPICSNARIIQGVNDLATLAPEIAKEWSDKNFPTMPTDVGIGSHKKAVWKGKCGHEWIAPIRNRVNGAGCPYCTHRAVLSRFNDLETVMPEVAKEWSERNYPVKPSEVAPFANKKVWWKCKEGHEWYTLISTRSGGSKCPYCTGIKVLKGFNDFATCYPELAKEWSERNGQLKPEYESVKSRKNVWWKCQSCGHEYKAVIIARAKGLKCPVCADRSVMTGYNDLATTDPDVLNEWDYEKNGNLLPTKLSRNSMQFVWWKCKFGHSRKDRICNRAIEHARCPSCEADFDAVFPKLLIMHYARKNNIKVIFDEENILGTPPSAYIPELNLAFDFFNKGTNREEKIGEVKMLLCKKRGIDFVRINPYADRLVVCNDIRSGFGRAHIFITSDSEADIQLLYDSFFEWRKSCQTD